MPFDVRITRAGEFVRFEVAGPPTLKNYFDLVEEAAKETAARGDVLALVDLRGVTGRLSFTDQFSIGDVVGDKLPHLQRVAVIVADDPETYNSPKVAQRKGVNVRSFRDEASALAWLTSR